MGKIGFVLSFFISLFLLAILPEQRALLSVRVIIFIFFFMCLFCQAFQNAPIRYYRFSLIYLVILLAPLFDYFNRYYRVRDLFRGHTVLDDSGKVILSLMVFTFFVPSSLYQCIPKFKGYLDARYPPPKEEERPVIIRGKDGSIERFDFSDYDRNFYLLSMTVGSIFTGLMGILVLVLLFSRAFAPAFVTFLFFLAECYYIKRIIENHNQ